MQYRQQRLESRGRRLKRLSRRLFARGYVKRQRAYRVQLGEACLKRLVLVDSHQAERLARALRAFEDSARVPRLVASFDNEVWVEFLDGARVEAADPRLPAALARMFAALCAREPRRRSPRELGLDRQARDDLRFLERVGVLEETVHDELVGWLESAIPEAVWVGRDYSDPRPSNFLWGPDGELRIVDVESLVAEGPIGRGVAKALVSLPPAGRAALLAELRRLAAPDFLPVLPFVELCFLASWQKRSVLQRKGHLVDPALFGRFRGGGPDADG